ncbi:protein of unknown function [Legionella micdadei]|uniref:Uncharacterized protein n=1 Tax=Legionella micdadei TaxID=451 RepID=A0A098GG31_LEGMI|nr:protein of unknown function [Legionella micdadei]
MARYGNARPGFKIIKFTAGDGKRWLNINHMSVIFVIVFDCNQVVHVKAVGLGL